MNKPNYESSNIVNLMSSIKQALGGKHQYNLLKAFNTEEIKNRNIILIVVDGLGYEFLTKRYKESFLSNHIKDKLTSVFPPTTAAAMTTLSTGLPPQQHALTGWYMYFKEIGSIITPLPFTTRSWGFDLTQAEILYKDLSNMKSFFEDLETTSVVIKHQDYIHSAFSQTTDKGTIPLGYKDFKEFLEKIKEGLKIGDNRKYIWAYWPLIDSLSHKFGTDSEEVKVQFEELDKEIVIQQSLSLQIMD
jgi:predicted AlkP superfamily pyrophosphatase or phosphodiesterase